jgi:ligand-binding sensor domain-containing protein
MLNTLQKFLTIAILAVFIFISALSADLVGAQGTATGPKSSRTLSNPLMSRYLRFVRLTAEDVLSGDHTRNVVQDQRGFMWIGTLSGLNRFDGASVKP